MCLVHYLTLIYISPAILVLLSIYTREGISVHPDTQIVLGLVVLNGRIDIRSQKPCSWLYTRGVQI